MTNATTYPVDGKLFKRGSAKETKAKEPKQEKKQKKEKKEVKSKNSEDDGDEATAGAAESDESSEETTSDEDGQKAVKRRELKLEKWCQRAITSSKAYLLGAAKFQAQLSDIKDKELVAEFGRVYLGLHHTVRMPSSRCSVLQIRTSPLSLNAFALPWLVHWFHRRSTLAYRQRTPLRKRHMRRRSLQRLSRRPKGRKNQSRF